MKREELREEESFEKKRAESRQKKDTSSLNMGRIKEANVRSRMGGDGGEKVQEWYWQGFDPLGRRGKSAEISMK